MSEIYYNDLEVGELLTHLPTDVGYRVSKVYKENKMVVLSPIIDLHLEDMVLKKEEVLRELFSREVSWLKEIELGLKNKRIEEANKAMRFNDGKLKWSLVHSLFLHVFTYVSYIFFAVCVWGKLCMDSEPTSR